MVASISVSLLYAVLILIKSRLKSFDFCVICASVFTTWMTMLALHLLDYRIDRVLVGILMGQSIAGSLYLAEKRLREDLKLFRLPFLLTMTFLGYHLLSYDGSITNIVFLLVLWVIFSLIHLSGNNRKLREMIDRLAECCKNW